MHDFLTALVFFGMLLTPCVIATLAASSDARI
jgi:hypothetical protein